MYFQTRQKHSSSSVENLLISMCDLRTSWVINCKHQWKITVRRYLKLFKTLVGWHCRHPWKSIRSSKVPLWPDIHEILYEILYDESLYIAQSFLFSSTQTSMHCDSIYLLYWSNSAFSPQVTATNSLISVVLNGTGAFGSILWTQALQGYEENVRPNVMRDFWESIKSLFSGSHSSVSSSATAFVHRWTRKQLYQTRLRNRTSHMYIHL